MEFNNLVEGILQSLNETKEAPDGYYYTEKGKLRKGNPASDGRGGPKYASDPTDRKNYGPREDNEECKKGKKKKKGLTGLALLAQQEQGEQIGRDGRGLGPDSRKDKEEDAEDREFFFGYDLENVHPVQEFVKANYKEGEYEMSIGRGDDVMNYLKVNVDLDDERGRKLLYMIEDCDGEGNYDEDDYEEDAEGKIDKDRMKCNSPRRTSGGSKKFVVKACKDGKEKIVRFGDPNMKIKKSNPKRRKSFRARHKCDQKKDKFSAGYWSCKKW
jgi:hypothetical protein